MYLLMSFEGEPCNVDGSPLPDDAPPPAADLLPQDDWSPYRSRLEFETAEFLFKTAQLSQSKTDTLMLLWSASLARHNDSPPFVDHNDLHSVIDATALGDAAWESFTVHYSGERPSQDCPTWMDAEYEVWFRDPSTLIRNIFSNPEFEGKIDYCPYREYNRAGNRRYKDFMSGNWAWKHAVSYAISLPKVVFTISMLF